MRVLFFQQQPCIRTLKYAAALRAGGYELGFACQGQTLTEWYGAGDVLFGRWWRLGPEPVAELARVVEEFRPDVVHSHNLPDRLTVLALEVVGGRDGFAEPADTALLEKAAVEGCAALVAVSEEMLAAPDAAAVRPRVGRLQRLPQQAPPRHRPAQQGVRVPGLRAAGG